MGRGGTLTASLSGVGSIGEYVTFGRVPSRQVLVSIYEHLAGMAYRVRMISTLVSIWVAFSQSMKEKGGRNTT
jgi:hypothetical protein